MIVALLLIATIATAMTEADLSKYCPTIIAIYGDCSPELVENWLSYQNPTPSQTIAPSVDTPDIQALNGSSSGEIGTGELPQPGLSAITLSGVSPSLTSSIITTTQNELIMPSKNLSIGGITSSLSLNEYYSESNPLMTTHTYLFTADNQGPATTTVGISSKTIEPILSMGMPKNIRFYSLADSRIEIRSDPSENKEVWYISKWDSNDMANLSIKAGKKEYYLLAFDTLFSSEGWFNLTLGTALGVKRFDPSVSSCTNIQTAGTYTVSGNITATADKCITIAASDVIFNCANYPIFVNYAVTLTGNTAIYVTNATTILNNITIKNCNIYNWTTGISFIGVRNSTIQDSMISNATGLFGAAGSTGTTTCTNGVVGTRVYGISLVNATNITVKDVSIIRMTSGYGGGGGKKTSTSSSGPCNGGPGGASYGIYANTQSWANTIQRVNISLIAAGYGGAGGGAHHEGGTGGVGGLSAGIWLNDGGSANWTITQSRITNTTGGRGGLGGLPVHDNICYEDYGCGDYDNCETYGGTGGVGGAAYGVYLNSKNNTLQLIMDNESAGAGGFGIGAGVLDGNGGNGGIAYALYSADTLNFGNSTISNSTGGLGARDGQICGGGSVGGDGGASYFGYFVGTTTANNFTFINSTAGLGGIGESNGADGTSYGFRLEAAYSNFSNGSISNVGTYSLLALVGTYNVDFLNVSLDKTKILMWFDYAVNLTMRWYGWVNVSNVNGTGVVSALNASDSLNRFSYQGTTSYTPMLIFNDTCFIGDGGAGDISINYNPHNLNASAFGYLFNQSAFSWVARDQVYNITLYALISPPSPPKIVGYGRIPSYIMDDEAGIPWYLWLISLFGIRS